jgi:hypothetical protein
VCAERLEDIGMLFNLSEIKSIFSKEIGELIEDEEIIIKTTSLITLFQVIYERKIPVIDP